MEVSGGFSLLCLQVNIIGVMAGTEIALERMKNVSVSYHPKDALKHLC